MPPNYPLILAARPKTLVASICPVFLATAHAFSCPWEALFFFKAVIILSCASLMQIGSNLANDYLDAMAQVDTPERLGPLRATSAGLVSGATMKRAWVLCLGVALALGILLSLMSGPEILALGVVCLLASYAYTPLGHYALGEVMAFLFYGPVAFGGTMYLLATGPGPVLPGAIVGLWSSSLMAINNLRDRNQDLKAHKRTLANLISEKNARTLTIFLILSPGVGTLLSVAIWGHSPWELLSLGCYGFLAKSFPLLARAPLSGAFNQVMAHLAKAMVFHTLVLALVQLVGKDSC